MKYASCHYENIAAANYCGRCRMAFNLMSFAIAWFFIPIGARLLSRTGSNYFIFGLTGFMGGAFLGSVDGMVEESTHKTVRGALIGLAGGLNHWEGSFFARRKGFVDTVVLFLR